MTEAFRGVMLRGALPASLRRMAGAQIACRWGPADGS